MEYVRDAPEFWTSGTDHLRLDKRVPDKRSPHALNGAAIIVAADTVAIAAACGLALTLHAYAVFGGGSAQDAGREVPLSDAKTIVTIGLFLMFSIAYGNLYKEQPSGAIVIKAVATTYASLLIVALAILRVHVDRPLSAELLVGLLLLPVIMLGLRFGIEQALAPAGFWRLPILVVGNSGGLAWIRQSLPHVRGQGYAVCGQLNAEQLPSVRHADWQAIVRFSGARRLLVAITHQQEADRLLLNSIMRGRVPFMIVQSGAELPVAGVERASNVFKGAAVAAYRSQITEPLSRWTKAAFDVLVASTLIVLAAPAMLAIALLVRADGSTALFAHERVGHNGRRFKCLKFRSMVPDPQRVLQQTLQSSAEARREWAERQKLTDDPRVTRIGRLLRATSLDELPQLFNVVRLDMSLVGPRPIVESEIPRYGDDIDYYYKTRPGLTGLWQVSGRSDTTYEQRVELDRAYVKNWSLMEDIMIILRTLPAVLSQRGAR